MIEGILHAAAILDEQAELCRKEGARLARKDPPRAAVALEAVTTLRHAAAYLRMLADGEPTQPTARLPTR